MPSCVGPARVRPYSAAERACSCEEQQSASVLSQTNPPCGPIAPFASPVHSVASAKFKPHELTVKSGRQGGKRTDMLANRQAYRD